MISYDVTEFGAKLQRFERPTPQPQGSEVLVRTLAAGVCHSDLHLWEGGYDLGSAGRLSVADRGVSLPFTMGHEIAGEVVSLGPDTAGERRRGRRANTSSFPWIGCGDCATCQSGEEHLCLKPQFLGIFRPGGYGDHLLVPHSRYLVPLGDLTPAEAAPYACSGVTTFGALRKLGDLIQRQPIVIIGAGGLGLMCLTLLKAIGGKGAVVVDIDETTPPRRRYRRANARPRCRPAHSPRSMAPRPMPRPGSRQRWAGRSWGSSTMSVPAVLPGSASTCWPRAASSSSSACSAAN